MNKTEKAYGITRLKSKDVRAAIIQKISEDFNLTPILAQAYYSQIASYFSQHADLDLKTGQVSYEAVAESEHAGKPIALCRKISVKLTLHEPQADLAVLQQKGIAGLRRQRLKRLTKEALDQGAVLSYEDLAILLTTSIVTVKRDVASLRREGETILSRGWRHDMGRGTSHKTQIIQMYLSGYQFSEIEQKTHHSEGAVARYLRDFTQVVTLHNQKLTQAQIRQVTGFSHRLVGEYLKLFSGYDLKTNDRLKNLVNPQPSQKKQRSRT
jgi:biotin operon repressor